MTDGIGNGERGGTGPVKVASGEETVAAGNNRFQELDLSADGHYLLTAAIENGGTWDGHTLNVRRSDDETSPNQAGSDGCVNLYWAEDYTRAGGDYHGWVLAVTNGDSNSADLTVTWTVWEL